MERLITFDSDGQLRTFWAVKVWPYFAAVPNRLLARTSFPTVRAQGPTAGIFVEAGQMHGRSASLGSDLGRVSGSRGINGSSADDLERSRS
jgi:hypothetical protein